MMRLLQAYNPTWIFSAGDDSLANQKQIMLILLSMIIIMMMKCNEKGIRRYQFFSCAINVVVIPIKDTLTSDHPFINGTIRKWAHTYSNILPRGKLRDQSCLRSFLSLLFSRSRKEIKLSHPFPYLEVLNRRCVSLAVNSLHQLPEFVQYCYTRLLLRDDEQKKVFFLNPQFDLPQAIMRSGMSSWSCFEPGGSVDIRIV